MKNWGLPKAKTTVRVQVVIDYTWARPFRTLQLNILAKTEKFAVLSIWGSYCKVLSAKEMWVENLVNLSIKRLLMFQTIGNYNWYYNL